MDTGLVAPMFHTGDMAQDTVAALRHRPVPSPGTGFWRAGGTWIIFLSFVTSHGMVANTSPPPGLSVLQP